MTSIEYFGFTSWCSRNPRSIPPPQTTHNAHSHIVAFGEAVWWSAFGVGRSGQVVQVEYGTRYESCDTHMHKMHVSIGASVHQIGVSRCGLLMTSSVRSMHCTNESTAWRGHANGIIDSVTDFYVVCRRWLRDWFAKYKFCSESPTLHQYAPASGSISERCTLFVRTKIQWQAATSHITKCRNTSADNAKTLPSRVHRLRLISLIFF